MSSDWWRLNLFIAVHLRPKFLIRLNCILFPWKFHRPSTWCDFCRHWWHRRLSSRQPPVPPVTTKFASWQFYIFKCHHQPLYTGIQFTDATSHVAGLFPAEALPDVIDESDLCRINAGPRADDRMAFTAIFLGLWKLADAAQLEDSCYD